MNRSQLLARCSAAAAIIAGLSAIGRRPAHPGSHPGSTIGTVRYAGSTPSWSGATTSLELAFRRRFGCPNSDPWISPRGLPYRRWR
jgi:hypothetical protein